MPNDASTKFLQVYRALHDFVASKPPEPFLGAAGQAMNGLASLAASLMIHAERTRDLDKGAGQEIPPSKVEGTIGHEKTKVRNGPASVPPRNGV